MKRILLVMAAAMTLLAGCGEGGKRPQADDSVKYNPFVEGFTSGRISRFSPVYLVFNQDIPAEKMSVAELPKLVKITPTVAGELAFENARTIVFRPADDAFRRGTSYTVTADLSQWFDTGRDSRDFKFGFSIYPLSLRATFESISTTDASSGFTIVCNLTTADREEDSTVESLVAFDEPVTAAWEHTPDGRHHTVTITGVEAADKKRDLEMKAGQNKLGVKQETLLSIPIPGRNDFTIYNVAFFSDPSRYVEVTFTEQLDENQNLNGIAFIEDNSSEIVTIEANKLRLYPDAGREGVLSVFLGEAIRSKSGLRLGEDAIRQVSVSTTKPSVRFVGEGVVIPRSGKLHVPFQAVNLRGVVVKVIRIFENNVGQFLQENSLDGYSDISRVGRLLARKVVFLDEDGDNLSQWNTFAVDLAEMIEPEPGAIYRVELSYDLDLSAYPCEDVQQKTKEQIVADNQAKFRSETENFDNGYYYYSNDFNWYDWDWDDRDNPCTKSYYRNAYVGRNVMASDLGIIAKRGAADEMTVLVHNILTTAPEKGVEVVLYNYQHRPVGRGTTDESGHAKIKYGAGRPYYLVAMQGNQRGYLHVSDGRALSMSTFDVSGEVVQKGIKGFIYGERGVWRPGETIHVGFMLNDRAGSLPANHPVTLELFNPLGQLYATQTQTTGEMGLYTFAVATESDSPTGAWSAKVTVGGVSFNKKIRVETVKPNRLKIALDLPERILAGSKTEMPMHVEWLQGATARNLDYEIEATFSPVTTRFDKYPGYTFDTPARRFDQEAVTVASGTTDEGGDATVDLDVELNSSASGMLNMNLVTRVFEESGDFSIDGATVPYSPYTSYVGVKSPQTDRTQLNTGTSYIYDVVSLGNDGTPAGNRELEVQIYKVAWYWWWNSDNGSLANYISNSYEEPVKTMQLKTKSNGTASFTLNYTNNEWGTYFIQVRDKRSGHIAGVLNYYDWPYSEGRRDTDGSENATKLSFRTDSDSYAPGDVMTVVFPSSEGSRAVVSIENGSGIVSIKEYNCTSDETTVRIDVTQEMQPNVYVHITLLQPHGATVNDLPIRMYGVVPVEVSSPRSHLRPVIATQDELRPEAVYQVSVSEKEGRPMAYTIAVVDEGLLDLTRFRTPDPWRAFNAREALGVSTWDMYNYVSGAYGGRIEQIFSIGGGDELAAGASRKTNRFAPVVQFDGPFQLKKGETRRHNYTMPNYNGRVRVMVVAGDGKAYGNAEKSVLVRKPVMLLGTLPRVIGVGEEMAVPATVFATEKGVGRVRLTIECSGNMAVKGASTQELTFDQITDKQAVFRIAVGEKPGVGTVKITATGKGEQSVYETDIEIRSVRRPQVQVTPVAIAPGESWKGNLTLPGADGTNSLKIEVSDVQPVNLSSRVGYLLGYPHGCIEQITSKGFPQLYLSQFTSLTPAQETSAQEAVKEVIGRMRSYQMPEGAFSYWPGGTSSYGWATVYATHFLAEAESKGYLVPDALKRNAIRNLSRAAKSWKPENSNYYGYSEEYTQAYRLYVLALAGSPETGAMNRLRESAKLYDMTRWTLAAAYAKIGRADVARELIGKTEDVVMPSSQYDMTFGSDVRDKAMQLIALCAIGDSQQAALLANEVSLALGSDSWMSTQTAAFSLMAMADYTKRYSTGGVMDFSYRCGARGESVKTGKHIWSDTMFENGAATASAEIKNNGSGTIFARFISEGTPAQGAEKAYSNAVALDVRYYDSNGTVDVKNLPQGLTFTAEVTVKNTTARAMNNLILSQVMPVGWEILNTRFLEGGSSEMPAGVDYQDFRDDRVYSYIDNLPAGKQVKVQVTVTTVYAGAFYLPPVWCEAMYDNLVRANTEGVQVVVE